MTLFYTSWGFPTSNIHHAITPVPGASLGAVTACTPFPTVTGESRHGTPGKIPGPQQ